MFQSENGDLIPRCAPKPSTLDVAAAELRPSVPEISIVFTQKETGQLAPSSHPTVVTSYSLWKNKCLPIAAYPTESEYLNTELSSTLTAKRSNMYPLRTGAMMEVVPSTSYAVRQIAETKTSDIAARSMGSSLKKQCSLESQTKQFSGSCNLMNSYSNNKKSVQKQQQPLIKKTLKKNVPTASAGTQTDNFGQEPHISTLATKEDIAEIKSMIAEMERGHRHLLLTLQNVLEEKFKLSSDLNEYELRDGGTQNNEQLIEGNLIQKPSQAECDLIEECLTEEGDCEDYQYKAKIQTSKRQPNGTVVVQGILNTGTEQSIIMNELAVKYLPNLKLNNMLPEVLIGSSVKNQYESPLKNKENIDQNQTDISTASYKYLRKYRLLPEENNNFSPCSNLPKLISQDKQLNLLDLDMIRCKPKFM